MTTPVLPPENHPLRQVMDVRNVERLMMPLNKWCIPAQKTAVEIARPYLTGEPNKKMRLIAVSNVGDIVYLEIKEKSERLLWSFTTGQDFTKGTEEDVL